MPRIFDNLVDVRAGEGPLVLRSTIILFGLIGAHTLLETARDALFLAKLPPSRLTLVYGALAGLAIVAGRVNARFVRSFGRRNALVFTLFGAAYGTVILYLLPATPSTFFALYVWSGLLGSVLVVQFWMYAGRSFTVAQSKRLFGLVAAGGVLGAVAGASLAVPLVSALPVPKLLLVAAGAFLATAVGVTASPSDQPGVPLPRAATPMSGALGVLKDNRYLVRLAMLIGLSTAAVLATDYLFKSVAAQAIPADELGGFFARYYAGLNAVALAVQLLVANALVRRVGVVAAFCVLPGLLLAGAGGVLVSGGALFAVLAAKGADGGLRHSLHRIAAELLWMPVADELRNRTKVFIDTVVVRGTQAATAAALLGVSMMGWASPRNLAIALAALAALWLLAGLGLRTAYLDLFRDALATRPREDRGDALQLDLDGAEIVVESLSSRDPVRAVAAIHLLASSGRARLIPALILYHESETVLLEGLDAIATAEREDWVPLAVRLLEHESQTVRFAALRALARIGDREAIQSRLLDISPAVRAHAAYWLAEADPAPPEAQPEVQQLLAMEGAAGAEAQAGLLDAIAGDGRARWSQVILQSARIEHPAVVEAAAHAMARVRDPRFIPHLLDHLRLRAGREAVRDAIVALGEPALDALEAALEAPHTPRRVRRHVPRTISRFGTQRAADILCHHMAHETNGRIRYKTLRGLGRMVREHPVRIDRRTVERQARENLVEHLRLGVLWGALDAEPPESPGLQAVHELLLRLVHDKSQQALERAFRLLQLVHRTDDLRSAYLATGSDDKARRAQALEFMDALTLDATVPDLRGLLRIAVDDLSWSDRAARTADLLPAGTADLEVGLGLAPKAGPDRQARLTRLTEDKDQDVARIATYYLERLAQYDLRTQEAPTHAG